MTTDIYSRKDEDNTYTILDCPEDDDTEEWKWDRSKDSELVILNYFGSPELTSNVIFQGSNSDCMDIYVRLKHSDIVYDSEKDREAYSVSICYQNGVILCGGHFQHKFEDPYLLQTTQNLKR